MRREATGTGLSPLGFAKLPGCWPFGMGKAKNGSGGEKKQCSNNLISPGLFSF
jgi:hypothetical protein